jgi:uncharacterized membrane protein (UPF0127 family)
MKKSLLVIALLLTGCSTEITSSQLLPISAEMKISNEIVKLEVAKTGIEIETGLMYRTSLPKNRGMVFNFEPAQKLRFWMKNCKIPLDMIFLRDGIVKSIAAKALPCKSDPCPNYGPNMAIDQVIELNGGEAARLSVKVGDRIKISEIK